MNFDKQAPTYDQRAGLPPAIAEKIANAVVNVPERSARQHVLEIGAGTGEIGCEIANLVESYIAIDSSPGMLEQFRLRCQVQPKEVNLLLADGNLRWPVAPGQVNLIFSSRALHLLDIDHVVQEMMRLSTGYSLWLVIGKVQKSADSVPLLMKQTMRKLLKANGIEGRSGNKHKEILLQVLKEKGARLIPDIEVASWQKETAPIESLKAWRNKSGLAGKMISEELKDSILDQVEAWARNYFGDLHEKQPTTFTYVLDAVCFSDER